MRIAIFSDIHGKILLPFKLVELYQAETGEKIDVIFQCGDIGAFPDLEELDKATIKHAKNDRDELGFHDDFTTEKPEIKNYLDQLGVKMICVRGNHEDHNYLNNLEAEYPANSLFPIDVYKRVWLCKSGMIQEFRVGEEVIRFVGIGRIGDRKKRTNQRFIQDYERREIEKLKKSNDIFDILITHDTDDSNQRGYGMSEIREVLDHVIFHYHFYGHTGEPFSIRKDLNEITQTCKIKELEFDTSGILPENCMVILEKLQDDQFEFKTVPRGLTNRLTKHNWKYEQYR